MSQSLPGDGARPSCDESSVPAVSMRTWALLVALCGVVAVLFVSAASALADEAPEAPQLQAQPYLQPTFAVFEGRLNPGKQGEPGAFESGEYLFRYAKSGSSCGGESETEPGLSSGAGEQRLEKLIEGLEGDTQYTVCLVVRSLLEHKEAVSAPVTFRTPERPEALPATSITASSATLHGVLNPKGRSEPGAYYFQYAPSTGECSGAEEGQTLTAPQSHGAMTGQASQSVEVPVSGLLPNTTYAACLVAEGESSIEPWIVVGPPVRFKTAEAAPAITEESPSSVASLAASVGGQISPGGLPTGYQVEYVSEAQFQASAWAEAVRVPDTDAQLPASSTPIAVDEQLTGLQPNTSYRFRFTAINTLGTTTGSETHFTTSSASATESALPDERSYELVSPVGEGEAGVPPAATEGSLFEFQHKVLSAFRIAANGEAVAWGGVAATAAGTGAELLSNQWLSTRTSSGWHSSDITPANAEETFFEYFSDDLSRAILVGSEQWSLAGQVSPGCISLYSRADQTGEMQALFDGENYEQCGEPLFAGEAADGSQYFFQDETALTANARMASQAQASHGYGHHSATEGAAAGCMFACNLYEESGGRLRLVNVLPGSEGHEGEATSSATFGGYREDESTTFSNAISADGSRVFWTDTQPGPEMEHIFVLENDDETVPVSGPGPADYWTASPDGRYAFYTEAGALWRFDTDTRERVQLTHTSDEASATGDLLGPGEGKGTLTEGSNVITDVSTSNGAFTVGQQLEGFCSSCLPQGARITAVGNGTLTLSEAATESQSGLAIKAYSDEVTSLAVTAGQFQPGEALYGPGVAEHTTIVGISGQTMTLSRALTASGSSVVLQAGGAEVQGVLGSNEVGEDGSYVYFVAAGPFAGTAGTEGYDLFVLHQGTNKLIATLAPSDDRILANERSPNAYSGDWTANVGERIVDVTPDGKHLVFQSARPLTGYDNRHAGESLEELYTYSAEEGRLVCNSCAPSGAPPTVAESNYTSRVPEVGQGGPALPTRFASANGNRVFFTSPQPLVEQDVNGVQDVYEWEREGEGSCAPQTPARADEGCVYLLSGGGGQIASYLLGSDESGENVFFTHVGPLGQLQAPLDHNLLYDARVKGGFRTPTQACTGTGCQGVPPAPPVFAAPATATFSGAGNFVAAAPGKLGATPLTRAQKLAKALKACRKDKKKVKRVACERQARARYSVKKAKRSAKAGRAGNERRAK